MLYIFTGTESFTEVDLAGLWPLLSKQRAQKVDKYRYFKDRKLSALAYILLRYALIEEKGIDEKVEFEFGPYGKPFIKGMPELQFSLSHSAEGIVCGLANSPVGVDIADIDPTNLDCIKSAMHPSEQHAIKHSNDKARTFARFWSMKESYLKYTGTGIDSCIADLDFSEYDENLFDYRLAKMQVVDSEKSVITAYCAELLPVQILTKIDLFDFLIGEPQSGKLAFA
ncbi:4'-phosphopantetheinyl transferase family protein [Fibrobacter sp.]|uniref:4'-phosphopantetheinyl transferase family protein n=1 Tax=Fibrobacter sp. TaxID=35828 RepID=UPI00386739E4